MSERITCIDCGGKLRPFGVKKGYSYYSCTLCRTIQLHPLPDENEITEAYMQDYAGAGHYEDANLELRKNHMFYLALADAIEKAEVPQGPVLDYGCGWGGFSAVLAERGREYLGVDLSEEMTEYCKEQGLNVRLGDAADPSLEKGSFSAVGMNAVLEHFTDPEGMLRTLGELLQPGGVIVSTSLTQPFAGFLGRIGMIVRRTKELPDLNRIFHPPWHVVFHSPTGMRRLAERCGLKLESVRPMGYGPMPGLIGLLRPFVDTFGKSGYGLIGERWPIPPAHLFLIRKI